jgi:hypothetical protein
MADDPLPPAPKRRSSTRRPKGGAEAGATLEAPTSAAPATINSQVIGVTPAVAEDGASLAADHVELRQSAVGRVEASQVSVAQGAIGAARGEHLKVENGAIGAAMGEQVEVSRGYARSILARQVQLDRSAARVVIAADVRTNQTAVMFLIARRVAGDVKVLLDWRGALAFGAAAGLVIALLRRGRKAG